MDSSNNVSSPSAADLLKQTELRLGLPGTYFSEKSSNYKHQQHQQKKKRGFTDAIGKLVLPRVGVYNAELLRSEEEEKTDDAITSRVVGWPPIRSYRKNTMSANPSKSITNYDSSENESNRLFVKVSMDGVPYLRNVDLNTYCNYRNLSSELEKMFSCFINRQIAGNAVLGSDYVLTYEDKDGDWMLVGDVPWDLFIETCKKLKIVRCLKAVGLCT